MPDSPTVQPVKDPIICPPYYEPVFYYDYDRKTGEAAKRAGRRTASYWYKTGRLTPGMARRRWNLKRTGAT